MKQCVAFLMKAQTSESKKFFDSSSLFICLFLLRETKKYQKQASINEKRHELFNFEYIKKKLNFIKEE